MKRRGATLVEVLVAIFVMALGMIALLTLFPIGALRMAQAIRDDRCAQCAGNAGAIANAKNIRTDKVVAYLDPANPATSKNFFTDDISAAPFPNTPSPIPYGPPDPNGPSNPVLVDPAGYRMAAGLISQNWAGGGQGIGILPRRSVSFDLAPAGTDIYRWFTLLDDMEFSRIHGALELGTSRDYLYSWAYLLQRPRASDPSVVHCQVLVFNRRPLTLSAGTGNLREFVFNNALFDTAANVVTINHGGPDFAPALRAGDWIMDATPYVAGGKRYSHASFHRVVSVTDTSDTQMEIEVQTPFRGNFGAGGQGTVIIFEGLVEVFDRGAGWK